MKITKFKFKQFVKLHLLKSRVYEYFAKITNANLDHVLVDLKRALQVIFRYNQEKKHILFIGLPSKLELKINSLTQHMAISNSFKIQQIILNNNPTSLSLKLTKKPDLIFLFDHKKSYSVLSKAWVAKIPVITFTINSGFKNLFNRNFYFINGNFKNIVSTFDKNVFFVGLNFLFKNLKKKIKPPRKSFYTNKKV